MSRPVDHDDRVRARDPLRSWCVTAPAGAGKTELLTQRMLALLAGVQEPEEVLAITFTRKAAAEMQARILQALELAAGEEPTSEHLGTTWQLARRVLARDEQQGWALHHNPTRLRILTIDGLCAALARQMPVVTALGGAPEPVEDAEPLYREAVAGLMTVLESPGRVSQALARLLGHLDNHWPQAEELLVALLGQRDQWLAHLGTGLVASEDDQAGLARVRAGLDRTLESIHRDALAGLQQALGEEADRLLEQAERCARQLAITERAQKLPLLLQRLEAGEQEPGWAPTDSPLWAELADWLLTKEGAWRQRWTVNEGAADGDHRQELVALVEDLSLRPGLLERLNQARALPGQRYSDEQWALLSTLAEVLPRLVLELYWVFQRHGKTDFIQVALAAIDALGSEGAPGEALLALDYQLQHVLVDEFQDTSTTQWRLLVRLLEGWVEHNASGAPPRTLFIVGDGMQSIYGFREADVGLFLTARSEGIHGIRLGDAPLSVNFRSDPAVVNWVNHHFSQAFPSQADPHQGAVPFEPATAFRPAVPGSEVKVLGCLDDPGRLREAEVVVEQVRRALAETEGDIAILVRTRNHLDAILPALDRAGIPWQASDIDPLARRAAVQDLLSLCRALLNPADRISWLALLRSPLCGLDHADLHALVSGEDGSGQTGPIWPRLAAAELRHALSLAGRARVDRLHRQLEQALAQRSRLPLAQWIKGCWLSLGGGAVARALGQQEDVERVFEVLDGLQGSSPDMVALKRAVDRLHASAGRGEEARVQLMTIHRSKGLEFETVILPGLDRRPASDDRPLLLWSPYRSARGEEGLVLAGVPRRGAEDPTYQWLWQLKKKRRELEDARLLYVAATRAERRLCLVFCAERNPSGAPRAPHKSSLLHCLRNTLEEEVEWLDATATDDRQPPPRQQSLMELLAEQSLRVLPTDWQPPPWPASLRPGRGEEGDGEGAAEEASVETGQEASAAAGRALHWLLEQLAQQGEGLWLNRDDEARLRLLEVLLLQEGLCRGQLTTARTRLQQAVERMLLDRRGRWLLFGHHHESWQELDLIHERGRSIIDRCFVAADGCRWIVDYKLSAPAREQAPHQFVREQITRYSPQLQRYAELFPGPVRTALYYPLLPLWLELTGDRIAEAEPEPDEWALWFPD